MFSDIDECMDQNGGCGHNCSNTVGSYRCSCLSGYTLNTTDNSCKGKQNCVLDCSLGYFLFWKAVTSYLEDEARVNLTGHQSVNMSSLR